MTTAKALSRDAAILGVVFLLTLTGMSPQVAAALAIVGVAVVVAVAVRRSVR